MNDEEEKQLSL